MDDDNDGDDYDEEGGYDDDANDANDIGDNDVKDDIMMGLIMLVALHDGAICDDDDDANGEKI